MKKMTCNQLGGACEEVFHAETFEEVAEKSRKHGMEMFQQGDPAHLEAMSKMQVIMESPEAMKIWLDEKRAAFDALPDQ
jgi:hypothetical protein